MSDNTIWNYSAFGETYLVSYAKAVLWERFHSDYGEESHTFRLRQADGEVSSEIPYGSLRDGSPTDPLGDFVPHLTIVFGNAPVMAIHFVDTVEDDWTSDFRQQASRWRETCGKLGITLVFVKVSDPRDITSMFATDDESQTLAKGYTKGFERIRDERQPGKWLRQPIFKPGFMPYAKNVVYQARMPPQLGREIELEQSKADRIVYEFMQTLVTCSPSVRRELILLLEQLDSFESLCPISDPNPFLNILRFVEKEYSS